MTDLQLWLSAIEIGSFFGLLALAFLLILTGSGFFNFALGPYAMVAGLGTSWLVIGHGVAVWLAIACGLAMAVAVSAITELVVVREVQRKAGTGEVPALVAVAAVLFAVQQSAGIVFGRVPLPGQQLLQAGPWRLGDVVLVSSTAVLLVVTVVVFVVTGTWVRLSRTGRLLRAVGDNGEAARKLGLPVSRVRLTAFVIGGLVAGIAGILFAPKAGVEFSSGLTWTISGFLALVVGGTGSIWAPLAGGLLMGVVQVFAPYYFGNVGPQTMLVLIALVFFAFKPEGLFVRRVRT